MFSVTVIPCSCDAVADRLRIVWPGYDGGRAEPHDEACAFDDGLQLWIKQLITPMNYLRFKPLLRIKNDDKSLLRAVDLL